MENCLKIQKQIIEISYEKFHATTTLTITDNKTRLAYNKLVKDNHSSAVKIFISATMGEIRHSIIENLDNGEWGIKPTVYEYSTDNDYSYVNPKYFKKIESIINTIKNDKSSDKWLIFVSDLRDARKIHLEMKEGTCSIIKAGTKNNPELNSIINNSKFDNKVLITTKVLDNGINIKDIDVKNIVIMAWDKITFVQMLGRKRIDINNAQSINLYMPTRLKKSFTSKIYNYNGILSEVDLFDDNITAFGRKYDNDLNKLGELNTIFYRDNITGQWQKNMIGAIRTQRDKIFAENMVNAFTYNGEFAFVKEQLKWIGLEDTFDECNLLDEDIVLHEDIETLEMYLDSIVGKVMLQAKDRTELIETVGLIDVAHSSIKDNRIKLLKNINTLNSYLVEIESNYTIKEFHTSRTINGIEKKYKQSWKVLRLSDN